MAGEFKHKDVGIDLSKAEWEGVDSHVLDSQATGDLIIASSATQLSRLPIGSVGKVLTVSSGLPAWSALTPATRPDSIKYIAADNSSTADKAAADIVCDGTNDEATINTAYASCKSLYFYAGDYYIDSMTQQANDSRGANNYYYGIGIPGYVTGGSTAVYEYYMIGVQGTTSQGGIYDITGVRFHVTAAALASVPGGKVACGVYSKPIGCRVIVKNFSVLFANNQRNNCHGVDMFNSGELITDNIMCFASEAYSWATATDYPVAVGGAVDADNIGFVDLDAFAETSQVTFVKAIGWSIGINFNADHLVAKSCCCWENTRDYRFGGFGVYVCNFPMVLIGCWSGWCKYGPLFTADVQNQYCSITWTGAHFENYAGGYYTNFDFVEGASEAVAGGTFGKIEYSLYSAVQTDFWKSGYGSSFTTSYPSKIQSGETRIVCGSLTAGNANAFAFAWQNPVAAKILVTRIIVEVVVDGGSANAVLDVGTGANATTHNDNFLDGANLHVTAVIYDSMNATDKGTNGVARPVLVDEKGGTTDYVTGQILVANAASLVGKYYIYYMGR
jgi:hypothetical protein